MLQILGAGLPRTGTRTLCEALRMLGYSAVHYEPKRLPLFPSRFDLAGCMDAYGDVQAATDCPAALHWRAITSRNPEMQVILTVRSVYSWWESIKWHTHQIRTGDDMDHIRYTDTLHTLLFGVAQPCEYWWKRRYLDHNALVRATIPAGKLLVMDIDGGDKWEKLCPFLGVREPDAAWPWENRRGELCGNE